MNKSAVRRALTTLKKNGVLDTKWADNLTGHIVLEIFVDADLIQQKKRVYIKKVKKVNSNHINNYLG